MDSIVFLMLPGPKEPGMLQHPTPPPPQKKKK